MQILLKLEWIHSQSIRFTWILLNKRVNVKESVLISLKRKSVLIPFKKVLLNQNSFWVRYAGIIVQTGYLTCPF